jgi:outer membrane protein OmpA-like peptidoglycan-associated protein
MQADLAQLRVLLDGERMPVPPDPEPVRIIARDDSFIEVLGGDVRFAFDNWNLKPAADQALEPAWAKIKANPRRRLLRYTITLTYSG